MYSLLNSLLCDKKDGIFFSCFGIWHFGYILLAALLLTFAILYMNKKDDSAKQKLLNCIITTVFCLYISDFFLMPIAYGEIYIENLPFHICTAMCVMCFLSRRVNFLKKYRVNFALLGFVCNLVYLIYPAGVMWHQVHPLSYRVLATLLFHGLMTVYGAFSLICEGYMLEWKKCYRDLVITISMTAWAIFGNHLYNGVGGDYSFRYNWFFVIKDPFGLFPIETAQYVMPILNIAMFFSVQMLVYLVVIKCKSGQNKRY